MLAFYAATALLVVCLIVIVLRPYGSLATLLWMDLLAARGFRVGWRAYLRYFRWMDGGAYQLEIHAEP